MDQYSLFFLTFSADLNADGRVDVIGIADAGGGNGSGTPNAHWYENPGPDKLGSAWSKHPIFNQLVSNESPAFQNVAGDAANELVPRDLFRGVFISEGKLGYAAPSSDPAAAWSFNVISGDMRLHHRGEEDHGADPGRSRQYVQPYAAEIAGHSDRAV